VLLREDVGEVIGDRTGRTTYGDQRERNKKFQSVDFITMSYLQKRQAKHHTHRYFVDSETNDAICLCGKVRGSARVGNGKNKYNAKTSVYNGYACDSGLEAKAVMELDWRLKAATSRAESGSTLSRSEGRLLRRHKVDFRVKLNDDSYELVEAKAWSLPEYKLPPILKQKQLAVVENRSRRESAPFPVELSRGHDAT
jgi:hypothetical protein